MKQTNENCKTMDVISFADFCRCMRQAMAENPNITEEELNTAVMQPILRKRRRTLEQLKAMERIDTSFEENSIAELRKAQADDYEGYINGDLDGEEFPDAFVILRREDLAPYFDEDTPAEEIDLMLTALLEADRIRNE